LNVADLRSAQEQGGGTLGKIAVQPGGALLAVAGSQGFWIYDKLSLKPLHLIQGHAGPVNDIAWDPSGEWIVTAGSDGSARLWDLQGLLSGDSNFADPAYFLAGHNGPVNAVAWSADGTRVATAGADGLVWIWGFRLDGDSALVSAEIALSHGSEVRALDWHPDSQHLLTGDFQGFIRLWDAADGTQVYNFAAHSSWPNVVLFSPDGSQFASGALDRGIRVWNLSFDSRGNPEAENFLSLAGTYIVNALAWAPDGRLISAGGSPFTLDYWSLTPTSADEPITESDLPPGQVPVVRLPDERVAGHTATVLSLAAAPGSVLLSSGADSELNAWDIRDGRPVRTIPAADNPHTGLVSALAWSPNADQFAIGGSDYDIRIISSADGETLLRLENHQGAVVSLDWSAAGQLLSGSRDGTARIWDASTGEELRVLPSEGGQINDAAWSPNGSEIATAGLFPVVQIWDVRTDRPPIVLQQEVEITRLAWAPGGTLIALGGADGTIRIWDIPAAMEVAQFSGEHSNRITGLAWSADNRQLASLDQIGRLVIWDANSGLPDLIDFAGPGRFNDLTWSGHGNLLAAAGNDAAVHIWDARTGTRIRRLAGHSQTVHAVVWSPNGQQLLSAGADGTYRLWDLSTRPPADPPPEPPVDGLLEPGLAVAEAILPGNAESVTAIGQIGQGTLIDLDIDPTGSFSAVSGGLGTWIYTLGAEAPAALFAGSKTYGVRWSPNSELVAVREIQAILIWDLRTGSVLRRFPVGIGLRDHLAWSRDSQQLAVGTFRNGVQVFDLASGHLVHDWAAGRDVVSVKFSLDNRYLAASGLNSSGEFGQIHIWDLATGDLMMIIDTEGPRISELAWSPAGDQLLVADDDLVLTVFDLSGAFDLPVTFDNEGEIVDGVPELISDSFSVEELTRIFELSWDADGTVMHVHDASGIYELGSSSHLVQSAIGLMPWAIDAVVEPNSAQIVSIHSDGTLRGAGLEQGGALWLAGGHLTELSALSWQPGSGLAASAGADGRVQVWDIKSTVANQTTGGELLISVTVNDEPVDQTEPNGIVSLSYAPDGQFLATRTEDGALQILNTANWDWQPWTIAGEPGPGAWNVAWSADSLLLAWDSRQELTSTIDIQGLEFDLHRQLVVGPADVTALAFQPLNYTNAPYRLSSGQTDGTVIFWDVDGGRALSTIQAFSQRVNALAWSADGRFLAVAGDDGGDFGGRNFIRVYNAAGSRLYELEMPGPDEARSLAWSTDGALLASGGSFGQVQIWDTVRRTLVVNLEGHNQEVSGVAWAPEELVLISAGKDGRIRLWGIPNQPISVDEE
jgi:WD40 repeat protein